MKPDVHPSADPQAEFVQLLTAHQSLIHTFVLSLAPHSPDVEDIVQQINLVLWRKRDDFEAGSNFRAWALTVSRFQVMAYRKKMALRRTDRLSDEAIDLLAADAAEEEPAFLAKHHQVLRVCFEKLGKADRELLIQRYWKNTPLRDFAVMTGRSEAALKSSLHRLRLALRVCLKKNLPAG
ncbi:sigma-70 family RNA polymerase sigma factor [Luteolibacter marinus]|uniref:sigma-70 family RNA polymerase sigma factor n=1 Tax=Luteolibacter marinus TaxID=2776705 RepID=UPI0018661E21|nr:sigma-70 family RNA polymerase sigma factor [Luteolibacter marinus]